MWTCYVTSCSLRLLCIEHVTTCIQVFVYQCKSCKHFTKERFLQSPLMCLGLYFCDVRWEIEIFPNHSKYFVLCSHIYHIQDPQNPASSVLSCAGQKWLCATDNMSKRPEVMHALSKRTSIASNALYKLVCNNIVPWLRGLSVTLLYHQMSGTNCVTK